MYLKRYKIRTRPQGQHSECRVQRMKKRRRRAVIGRIAAISLMVAAAAILAGGTYLLYEIFIAEKETIEARNIYEVMRYVNEPEDTAAFEKKKTTTVMLDAGHGGKDIGTSFGRTEEKDVTLSVVQKMQRMLEEAGVTVLLTRDGDEHMRLPDRAFAANRSEADLFVSIHCNYYDKDSSIRGLECYYWEGSEKGKQYAENIIDKIKQNENTAVRGAKTEDFYVLENIKMPTILVELGYFSNRAEYQKLISADYQEELAEELVESILKTMKAQGIYHKKMIH